MKNVITYLKTLWSWGANSQSSDVSHDCRLTRGVLCFLGKLARRIYSFGCSQDILGAPQSLHSSPSGMTAKLQVNSFMRFAVVLTLIFSIGSGNMWGAEGDTHDFEQTLSQSLNNKATIKDVKVDEQSYSVKTVKVTVVYDKNAEGATVSVKVGGVTFGKAQTINSNSTKVFTYEGASAVKGEVVVSSVNNCGWNWWWDNGTFQITNVQLTEGPDESCTANPTIGTAQLKGPFNLSSIGVTCPSIGAGSNCDINDYGFVWKAGGAPSSTSDGTKVQVGTNNQSTAFDGTLSGTLSGTFNTTTTYYVKAYATNNGDNTTLSSTALEINPRSITFNSNGGSSVAQIFVNSGSVATQPADPTKKGYTFAGWYKEEGLENAVNWQDNITENKTYYAKWTGNPYTIILDNQDATTEGTTSISVTYGEDTNLSGTPAISVPTKTGYTFGGYYTETNGGGTQIIDAYGNVNAAADDGTNVYTSEIKEWIHIGDATLYAKWTINNYTVSWSVNGSTYTTTDNVTYNTTTSTPANPSVPGECTGSTFMGWTATQNYTGDNAPGDLFNGTTPTITGNITFYAVFADYAN